MNGKRHAAVVGLLYGDEGKGSVVDYLSSGLHGQERTSTVVRFNGGAQAGHRVVSQTGLDHTFSQFGSGTFNHAHTHLSKFMLVDPLRLAAEAEHLSSLGIINPLQRVTVDRRALVTTPFHALANKALEEARGEHRHGSCGVGIGETVRYSLLAGGDAIRVEDIDTPFHLRRKLRKLRDFYVSTLAMEPRAFPTIDGIMDAYVQFSRAVTLVDEAFLHRMLRLGRVVFEGAQGVMLDQDAGTHPYTTWSKCGFDNALALLDEAGEPDTAELIGVTRAYSTRHGAGPFPTEDARLTAELPDVNNVLGDWQGPLRVGHLDLVSLRYAVRAAKPETIVVTNMDRAFGRAVLKVAHSYDVDGVTVADLSVPVVPNRPDQAALTETLRKAKPILTDLVHPADEIEAATDTPVRIVSYGATSLDKAERAVTVAA